MSVVVVLIFYYVFVKIEKFKFKDNWGNIFVNLIFILSFDYVKCKNIDFDIVRVKK